jgi:hypothetical protein
VDGNEQFSILEPVVADFFLGLSFDNAAVHGAQGTVAITVTFNGSHLHVCVSNALDTNPPESGDGTKIVIMRGVSTGFGVSDLFELSTMRLCKYNGSLEGGRWLSTIELCARQCEINVDATKDDASFHQDSQPDHTEMGPSSAQSCGARDADQAAIGEISSNATNSFKQKGSMDVEDRKNCVALPTMTSRPNLFPRHVVIIDDMPMILKMTGRKFKKRLDPQSTIEVIRLHSTETWQDFISKAAVECKTWDLCLVDQFMEMQDTNTVNFGTDLIPILRELGCTACMVMHSGNHTIEDTEQYIKSGASGVIGKGSPTLFEEAIEAFKAACPVNENDR